MLILCFVDGFDYHMLFFWCKVLQFDLVLFVNVKVTWVHVEGIVRVVWLIISDGSRF